MKIYDKNVSYNSENNIEYISQCTDIIPKGLIGNINVKVETIFVLITKVFFQKFGITNKIWMILN